MSKKLLMATSNAGKLREVRALLAAEGIVVLGLADIAVEVEINEDADTFLGNAEKKAWALHEATGLAVLADDSGLAVEALGGRPGVRSARYAGEGATDRDNYLKLLEEMENTAPAARAAAFVCAMVYVDEGGHEFSTEGRLEGVIATAPAGEQGFGYDPVFLLPEPGVTLAQIDISEKNKMSHRAQALEKMLEVIKG